MGDDIELGRTAQHQLDPRLLGVDEVAGDSLEQSVDRRQELRLAEHRRQVALGAGGPQELPGGEVGAHDAALAIDRHQRIGKAVDDGLGRRGQVVDRGALAAPAGGKLRRGRRQLLGGGREGQPRHDRLALVGQLAHEAREQRQRDEVALHQQHRHHADGRHGDQGRPPRQLARPVQRQQRRKGRREGDGIGREVATKGHRRSIAPRYSRRGEKKRSATRPYRKPPTWATQATCSPPLPGMPPKMPKKTLSAIQMPATGRIDRRLPR